MILIINIFLMINIILIINMILTYFGFFGRGDVSPTYSELCRFVSGS